MNPAIQALVLMGVMFLAFMLLIMLFVPPLGQRIWIFQHRRSLSYVRS